MRKRLSYGPHFPLIRGMFVFRSGLRFSFRALEVPGPRMRKRLFSLTKMTFSSPFFDLLMTLTPYKHLIRHYFLFLSIKID